KSGAIVPGVQKRVATRVRLQIADGIKTGDDGPPKVKLELDQCWISEAKQLVVRDGVVKACEFKVVGVIRELQAFRLERRAGAIQLLSVPAPVIEIERRN